MMVSGSQAGSFATGGDWPDTDQTFAGTPAALPRSPRRARLKPVSPFARTAILLTLACFSLLVVFDVLITVTETDKRLELEAHLLATRLADADLAAGHKIIAEMADALGADTVADVTVRPDLSDPAGTGAGADNSIPALYSRRYIPGPLDEVVVSTPLAAVLTPVMQRSGLGAIALLILLGFTLRRMKSRQNRVVTQASFDELLTDIPSGIACWSPDGLLIAANSAFRNKLGIQRSALKPGSRHTDTFASDEIFGARKVVMEGPGYRRSNVMLPDGCAASLEEVYSANGSLVMMISDRQEHLQLHNRLNEEREKTLKLSQSLQEQQLSAGAAHKSTKAFLAHLNHEIRTPLNHIIGFADLIRHQSYGPLGDRRYVNYIGHILQSGENLLSAITKMLELADFEAGQTNLKKERFAARELIEWATKRYADKAERARIQMSSSADCTTILEADRMCLQRMLGNLLENALRYTPAGGEVTLALWTAADGVVIEISDTGIGIPSEQLNLLNQSFLLGASTFKLDQSRTGMGIAVARAIAEISGGQLAIDSSPSIGTTVAVSLPAAAGAGTVQQRAA